MKNLFIFILLCLITGCLIYHPPGGGLSVKNNSDETIFVYLTCENSLSSDYPLKLYHERGNEYDEDGNSLKGERFYLNYRIESGSQGLLFVGGTPNHPKVNCSTKSYYLFFITESDMKKYKWKEIVSGHRYQKKMQFTQQQLDSMKWVIEYS